MGEAVDYEKFHLYFELFLFLWNVGCSIWLFFGRTHKEVLQRIDDVEQTLGGRIDAYEGRCMAKQERITRLESRIKEMPSHNDLGRIHDRITSLGGDLREMKGVLDGTAKSVERLHRYLLEHDRHK